MVNQIIICERLVILRYDFQIMALPKPIILLEKDDCPEYEILFPCIAEWA